MEVFTPLKWTPTGGNPHVKFPRLILGLPLKFSHSTLLPCENFIQNPETVLSFNRKPHTIRKSTMNHTELTIDWPCDMVVASKRCEVKISEVVHRKGEWGRGRDLPQQRLDEIGSACDTHGVTLHQALSLRRSMLRSFPGGMRRVSQSSKMGSSQGQQ